MKAHCPVFNHFEGEVVVTHFSALRSMIDSLFSVRYKELNMSGERIDSVEQARKIITPSERVFAIAMLGLGSLKIMWQPDTIYGENGESTNPDFYIVNVEKDEAGIYYEVTQMKRNKSRINNPLGARKAKQERVLRLSGLPYRIIDGDELEEIIGGRVCDVDPGYLSPSSKLPIEAQYRV